MLKILFIIENHLSECNAIRSAVAISAQCGANLLFCTDLNEPQQLWIQGTDHQLKHILPANIPCPEQVSCMTAERVRSSGAADVYISHIKVDGLYPGAMRELVVRQQVWLILMKKPSLSQFAADDTSCSIMQLITKINAPVLLMPDELYLRALTRIAYITDLRYCDLGVICYLKRLNVKIWLIHVTAPGMVDIDEHYAQKTLLEDIRSKTGYESIALRNCKKNGFSSGLNRVCELQQIEVLAFFNNNLFNFKHLMSMRDENTERLQQLPFLVFPYCHWQKFNPVS